MHNFFVTFIEVLRDRPPGQDWELEPGVTCGDYLFGMLQVRFINYLPSGSGDGMSALYCFTVDTYHFGCTYVRLYDETFLQGTRSALYANERESITVTVQEVTPRSVGALIALYERAVGIYASLVNINAYHQPGKYLYLGHHNCYCLINLFD